MNWYKKAQAVSQLTSQQQDYIENMADFVKKYTYDLLQSKSLQEGWNPNLVLTSENIEDLTEEGLIKAMEVTQKYWDTGKDIQQAIKTSLDNLIDRAMVTSVPNTTEEYLRQYTTREPNYKPPERATINFMDEKVANEFGPRIFSSDPQTLTEAINYVYEKYKEELEKHLSQTIGSNGRWQMLLDRKPYTKREAEKEWGTSNSGYLKDIYGPRLQIEYVYTLPQGALDKQFERYKDMRVLESGGRIQIENRNTSELNEEELLGAMGFENLPQETSEQIYEKERFFNEIKIIIAKLPNRMVRLAAALLFGLDLQIAGFDLNSNQYKEVLDYVSKPKIGSEGDSKWERIRDVLVPLGNGIGQGKAAQKVKNMTKAQFIDMLRGNILEMYNLN